MVWQDAFPGPVSHLDAEQEREQRLAAQARAGAEWALAALIARYQPPVTRYLTRLTGSADLAAAIAEQVFMRMERRLRGPHGGENLRLWLLRAATESGLDALRRPKPVRRPQLAGPRGPTALIAGRASASSRMRAGLGALAHITGSTSRQVRQLIWSALPEAARVMPRPASSAGPWATSLDAPGSPDVSDDADGMPNPIDSELDREDPRETLRYRIVRAVLAELPYGDAQCLALHLVGGLNQAEAARALGITPAAARRRIVQGLQLFSARYEAAVVSLGLPRDFLAAAGQPTPAPALPLWSRATMPPPAPPPVHGPLAAERPAAADVAPPPAAAIVEAAPPPEQVVPETTAATAVPDSAPEPLVVTEVTEREELAAGSEPPARATDAAAVQRVVDALPPAPAAFAAEPEEQEAEVDTDFVPRVVPVLTRPLPIALPEPETPPPPDLSPAAAEPHATHDDDDDDAHEAPGDHAADADYVDAFAAFVPVDVPRVPVVRVVPVLTQPRIPTAEGDAAMSGDTPADDASSPESSRSAPGHIPGTAPAVLPSVDSSPGPRVVPVLTAPTPVHESPATTEALAEVAAGPRAPAQATEAAAGDRMPSSPQQREEHRDA